MSAAGEVTVPVGEGWPTPMSMHKASHALDAIAAPNYGSVLRAVADAIDGARGPQLPTEPTWGFGVWNDGKLTWLAQWRRSDGNLVEKNGHTSAGSLVDFIPLTDEQVARIEAAS